MENRSKKSHHQFYLPWYAGDEDADNWMAYIHRNLHHLQGEDAPFTNTSWRINEEDAQLHDEVLDALYKSDQVDASRITVTVIHGKVELRGRVDTKLEKENAGKIVSELKDVWLVNNELEVLEESAGYQF